MPKTTQPTCRRQRDNSNWGSVTPAPKPLLPAPMAGKKALRPTLTKRRGERRAREEAAESGGALSHPPLLAHCPLHPPSALQPRRGCTSQDARPRPCPHSRLGVHRPRRPPTSYRITGPPRQPRCPPSSAGEGKAHHPARGCRLPTRPHVNPRAPPRLLARPGSGPQSAFPSGLLQPLPRILHTEKLLRISSPQTKLPNNSAAENVNVLRLRNPGRLHPQLGRAPLFKEL